MKDKLSINKNILKLIAFIIMIINHIEIALFSDVFLFRLTGRIGYPIFAFITAEGFFYTKNQVTAQKLLSNIYKGFRRN